MDSRFYTIAKNILRILLGVLFILTAVLKLIGIDNFEVYIFSFNIFSFTLSTLIARAVIAAEFILGGLLISKIFYKQAWWLTMTMLAGFTLLLIYIAIFRNDENCHCFGELIQLDPISSIIKNIIMAIAFLFVRKEEDYRFKLKKLVLGLILGIGIIGPFGIVPPDAIYNKLFSKNNQHFDEQLFQKSIQDSLAFSMILTDVHREVDNDSVVFQLGDEQLNLSNDKYLIAILSASCPHCKLSMKKANTIFSRNGIDSKHLKMLIWGAESTMSKFLKETDSDIYETRFISPYLAIDLVEGSFPSFLLYDHGKFIKILDYRTLDESELKAFFKEN